jgi:type IV secretion system protein VirB10
MSVPPPPEPPEDPENPASVPGGGEDPFAMPTDNAPGDGFAADEEELDSGIPAVAASKGRVMIVSLALGAVVLFLLYNIFSSSDAPENIEPKKINIVQAPPENRVSPPPVLPLPSRELPSRNDRPSLPNIAPPPSFRAPNIPSPEPITVVDPEVESAAREQMQARQRSGIIVSGGGGGLLGSRNAPTPTGGATGFGGGGANGQFAASVALTRAERSVATKLGNLHQTIGQGRLIHATLESAINTDLPTQIRAIVSRDVYGEAGRTALIPKGSRLIGVYNTSLTPGQSRVFVVWQRVIRPDGVDIQVGSIGVDSLGAAGLAGFVDTKFQQIFSRAVLASVISIALATGAEAINGDDGTSTTSSSPLTGGTTVTQQGTSGAVNSAIDTIGVVTQGFLTRFLNVQPTIIVDQGTPINVMLNRDLFFPGNVAGATVIQ